MNVIVKSAKTQSKALSSRRYATRCRAALQVLGRLALVTLMASALLPAQNVFPSTGNVGIGTASPSTPLFIQTPSPSGMTYPSIAFGATGHSTEGRLMGPVTSGGEEFYLSKNMYFTGSAWYSDSTSGNGGFISLDGSGWPYPIAFYVSPAGTNPRSVNTAAWIGTDGSVYLTPSGGKVGIGTTNPQHLLHVAGTIGAEEVIVSSTGADYVFRPGYRLQPLNEVSDFINENHHLPDIPSEAEVKEKGLSLGEMQTKLLAKIEELTLHVIEADKRSRALERENQDLRDLQKENQSQINQLKKLVELVPNSGGGK